MGIDVSLTQRPDAPKKGDADRVRRALTAWSMSLRRRDGNQYADEPRFVAFDNIKLLGRQVVGRKKVILMTGGCSIPTCTMCPFTNENNYGHQVYEHDLVAQVQKALERTSSEPQYQLLSLYNDGSFFAPKEIPSDVQIEIARLVRRSGVSRLVVESLPKFITRDRLAPFVEELGEVALEVGIGFQSAHAVVREILVNTRVSEIEFNSALSLMRELGVDPKIYLMIKPPFVSEEESLTDVLESVAYLKDCGIGGVTLCPTRVSRHTVAWELYQSGDYMPPNLWTVFEAVRIANQQMNVRIACINLRGSDFASVYPDSCSDCANEIVDRLLAFSETGETDYLNFDCECRQSIVPAPLQASALIERAMSLLNEYRRMV